MMYQLLRIVCSPPKVESLSVPIYLTLVTFFYLSPSFTYGNQCTAVCVCEFLFLCLFIYCFYIPFMNEIIWPWLYHLAYFPQSCNWTKWRFGCLLQQKPVSWGRCWCKKKKVLFRCCVQPGRMMDSPLKGHLYLPAQTRGSYRDREGRAFLPLAIHLSSFRVLGACLFVFPALCAVSVRTSPCCHVSQSGSLPSTLTSVCSNRMMCWGYSMIFCCCHKWLYFIFSYDWVVFPCVHVPHSFYVIIYWPPFRCFPVLATVSK